jgi:hypothetical protein
MSHRPLTNASSLKITAAYCAAFEIMLRCGRWGIKEIFWLANVIIYKTVMEKDLREDCHAFSVLVVTGHTLTASPQVTVAKILIYLS